MEQSLTINLSSQDLGWIKSNLPSLSLAEEGGIFYLRGIIDFNLFYNPQTEELIFNPSENLTGHEYQIRDAYEIEVKFEKNKNSIIPQVRDVGGRLETLATRLKTDIRNLHVQDNGSLCLCARQEERRKMPDSLNLEVLFYDLIYPFFYSNSFFERTGRRPWKDLNHGALGILEYYFRAQEERNIKLFESTVEALCEDKVMGSRIENLVNTAKPANAKCLCGSGRKFTNCSHSEALAGLLKLQSDIDYFDSLENVS